MAVKVIEEDEFGLYIWVTDDGLRVADEDGNTMNIPARKGDVGKIRALRQAARYWGVEGGHPVFLSGRRQVTDSEYDHQIARAKAGLIPDPLDYNAMKEELKHAKKYGR